MEATYSLKIEFLLIQKPASVQCTSTKIQKLNSTLSTLYTFENRLSNRFVFCLDPMY